jgi:hypothetical protein
MSRVPAKPAAAMEAAWSKSRKRSGSCELCEICSRRRAASSAVSASALGRGSDILGAVRGSESTLVSLRHDNDR